MKIKLLLVFLLALAPFLAAGNIYISHPSPIFPYTGGGSLHVSWFSEDPFPPGLRVSVWLKLDTATVQIGNDIPVERGDLYWMIPRTVYGSNCRVSLIRQGTSTVLCTSPAPFWISPPTRIKLLSPNGGERFTIPGTFLVRWEATDIVTEHNQEALIQLCYYPSGCKTGEPIVVSFSCYPLPRITSGAQGYRFTIPPSAPLSSAYFIRIRVQSSAYRARGFNKARYDDSDNCFTVTR